MWGVAILFTSGHQKGGSTEPLKSPLATGMYNVMIGWNQIAK